MMMLVKITFMFNIYEHWAFCIENKNELVKKYQQREGQPHTNPIYVVWFSLLPTFIFNIAGWSEGTTMVYFLWPQINRSVAVVLNTNFSNENFHISGGASLALTPFEKGLLPMQLAMESARIGFQPMVVGAVWSSKSITELKWSSHILMLVWHLLWPAT